MELMQSPEDKFVLLKRRDIKNFLKIRFANPGDDFAIGDLLQRSFQETYALKIPGLTASKERLKELQNVTARRKHGIVRVLDFGFRIIGTYSLIHSLSEVNESWTPNTVTLRCLAIDPEFHTLKLSHCLLEDAVSFAKTWDAEKICLHVQDGAHGVAKLYESLGFQRSPVGDKESYGNRILGYTMAI